MRNVMQFDRGKLKKLVHYAISRAGGSHGIGAADLYRAIWFAEARSFELTGRPITGAVYVRQERGPVPKLDVEIRNELEAEGKVASRKVGEEWFLQSKTPADDTFMSKQERQTLDHWIGRIGHADESHDHAWRIAAPGEELPFYAVLANRLRKPNETELKKAKERAKELGLL
jgi:hypothetical protein